MDYVRLKFVRWRGVLPASSVATPAPPLDPTDFTSSQLPPEPGFRCVWVQGRAQSLNVVSPIDRQTCMELEADALCAEILNVVDVRLRI